MQQREDELLDVKDVAIRLRVNPRTVLRMAERGDLPAIKVARRWRFRHSALDEYLREQHARPGNMMVTREELAEPEAQLDLVSKEQTYHNYIATQIAGSGKQMTQLEIEKQRLEIEKQRLEIEKQRLELDERRLDSALTRANQLASMLHPNDEEARAKLLQHLLSSLLESGHAKSLVFGLVAPKKDETEERDREMQPQGAI